MTTAAPPPRSRAPARPPPTESYARTPRSVRFITDTHGDGSYTLFVPTGPNPTSGLIFHLEGRFVHPVNVPVQDAMRSIISCGAGSARLFAEYAADRKDPGQP